MPSSAADRLRAVCGSVSNFGLVDTGGPTRRARGNPESCARLPEGSVTGGDSLIRAGARDASRPGNDPGTLLILWMPSAFRADDHLGNWTDRGIHGVRRLKHSAG